MASKISRKGKNPGPVDSWLDTLGYYRKNVAFDETCLFRAVAEQILACQLFHEKIRKECIEYAKQNYHEFHHLVPSEAKWIEHLDKLAKHMAVCGDIEIHIISQRYKKDVIVFDSINRNVQNVTGNNYEELILICLMGEDHYDVVYKSEYIASAGFCQSIVYNILYENVFEIEYVPSIVQAMLYDKAPLSPNPVKFNENQLSSSDAESERKDDEVDSKDTSWNDLQYMYQTNLAPFPFKVAKALDPNIYRNIEYDTWTETRKEMRLGDWYYGDNNLILGTSCILKSRDSVLQCYIQEILKEEDKCVVYITSLAEKRIVNYGDLSPEDDAKPWPLPYRFSKNLLLCPSPEVCDKDQKNSRKRKDKKHRSSKSSSDGAKNINVSLELTENNVTAYEGCPLQMQQTPEIFDTEVNPAEYIQPPVSVAEPIYHWDVNWGVPVSPEPIIWTQSPTTPQTAAFSFSPKAIVPTTPDASYPELVYYNQMGSFNRFNMWNPDCSCEPPIAQNTVTADPYNYVYYNQNNYAAGPNVTPTTDNKAFQVPPVSPQVEMYQSPIYAQPMPTSPIMYGTPEISEVAVPQTPQMSVYSPQMELSYMSPTPYIYTPTPPSAWYPPGINSQGFIFPTVNTQNVTNRI